MVKATLKSNFSLIVRIDSSFALIFNQAVRLVISNENAQLLFEKETQKIKL